MKTQDFIASFEVKQTPKEVFDAVNNVRGWWSEEIEGRTNKLHDEFNYHYKDVHICRMKLVEVVTNKKVIWKVLSNYFNFTKDKNEWTGDTIIFDITEQNGKTQLHFTHEGLTPEYECYEACYDGWSNYIKKSLYNLVTTGKGQPNPKEGGFNQELIEKLNLKAQS